MHNKTNRRVKVEWKRSYSIVLLVNFFYLLFFYFLMQLYQ